MRPRRRLIFASIVVLVAACGSRTGLLVPLPDDTIHDAAADNVVHHVDASPDVFVEEDALPPLDVTPPPPDTYVNDCPDAGSTLIYVMTEQNNLYSFYPPTAEFKEIGTIACPDVQQASTPFSMAVNRAGIAYVVFSPSGQLYRVSTASAACEPTPFASEQEGFPPTFGMGFSADEDGGETLYVAGDTTTATGGFGPSVLGTIDVTSYDLSFVGPFVPTLTAPELTGTGGGGLFGFWGPNGPGSSPSAIVQIDKATAQVTNSSTLNGVEQGSGWAFAFWGGDFYAFTAPGGGSVVTRFSPSDGSITQVASLTDTIVGAGVSTCAPQQ